MTTRRAAAVLATSLFTGSLIVTPAQTAPPEWAPVDVSFTPGMPVPRNLSPGDRVRDAGGAILEAPPPGFGVTVTTLTTSGQDIEFALRTELDGTVNVLDWGFEGDEVQTGGGGGPGPDPCDDTARNHTIEFVGGTEWLKWYQRLDWRIRTGAIPGNLNELQTIDSMRQGISNITQANTNCPMSDLVGATSNYDGSTASAVNIPEPGIECGDANGLNVVSFGDISNTNFPTTLAVTCVWDREHSGFDEIYESDVRFDNTGHTWTNAPGGLACSGDFSIEAVMTHERGHSFGLAHVTEANHAFLTMSSKLNGSCQNSESTLGRGDLLGLQELY